jgi:hypothetical protein
MINLTGLNKAELLAALFNYAHDMKDALRIIDNESIEEVQKGLIQAQAELISGKTSKTTSIKDKDVKSIIRNIESATTNNEYLTKDTARDILDNDKTLKRVNGVSINMSFKGDDLDTTNYNSMYGQWAAENIANNLKDYISLNKQGNPKKTKT